MASGWYKMVFFSLLEFNRAQVMNEGAKLYESVAHAINNSLLFSGVLTKNLLVLKLFASLNNARN